MSEAFIDFVSTVEDVPLVCSLGFVKTPGGAMANVAVELSRRSVNSGFIGKVDDDSFGSFLRTTLNQNNVNTLHLISDSGCQTSIAFVAAGGNGNKDVISYRNPEADMLFTPDDAKHWMWEVVPYANVVTVAKEEWEPISSTSSLKDGSKRILEIGVNLVVATRGEHGSQQQISSRLCGGFSSRGG